MPVHDTRLEDVPEHLTTKAGLRLLGLSGQRLPRVATVVSFGKTIPLYDVSAHLPAQQMCTAAPKKTGS